MSYQDNVRELAKTEGAIYSPRSLYEGVYEPSLRIKGLTLLKDGKNTIHVLQDSWNGGVRLFVQAQAVTRCDLNDLQIKGDDFAAMCTDAEVFFADFWNAGVRDGMTHFLKHLKEADAVQIVPKH
ncbi:MAG: hypothetical protein AB203_00260 [Parcubacteria bacterium C7867-008]|nr:MAG: hypothetical protein AB203_00260 [Parcubacteria bacterium C7867-008]